MKILNKKFIKSILPKRPDQSNKGTFGKLLCVCGSTNMMGAAILAVRAAYAAGAGYVTAAIPEKEKNIIFKTIPEAVLLPLKTKKENTQLKTNLNKVCYSAILAGCGLDTQADKLMPGLIKNLNTAIVLDGDALNWLAKQKKEINFKFPAILTPHPLEAARLLHISETKISHDKKVRVAQAKQISAKYNCVCVLKGKDTVIACKDKIFINPAATSALAKAGTGDVLAGIIAGLLTQNIKAGADDGARSALNAACAGVYLHSECAKLAGKEFSNYSVMASDLHKYIGKAIKNL
ncbi:NAD(P)H-hydrate epimerase [Elusimicrobium posterum]|uniref:NAD(P)H-hydrate dehydratase n=1 Tax=Elusimicrobium posterum TaxID=3116653 RepID=UPI003C772DEC